jgi:uncharacterized protein
LGQRAGSPSDRLAPNGRSRHCGASKSPRTCNKKHGFKPLGGPLDAVKTAIFSGNKARLYNIDVKKAEQSLRNDQFAALKRDYDAAGGDRSNLRYGYMNV